MKTCSNSSFGRIVYWTREEACLKRWRVRAEKERTASESVAPDRRWDRENVGAHNLLN